MIGAIIGDVAGSIYEFNNTSDYNFPLLTRECFYTDDTVCTIAVADAIVSRQKFKGEMLCWCQKYSGRGYGARFAEWLESRDPQPYNSFGNGSAMRVSPVGWACETEEEVLDMAKRTAEITHNHPEGIKGAQAIALAIFKLRKNPDMSVIDEILQRFYPDATEEMLEERRGVFDETCQGTVPIALMIFKKSNSFEDAIRRAISYGGDSDTLGAIVGSMAEALFDVPEELRVGALVHLSDEMLEAINNFKYFYNSKASKR